MNKDLTKGVKVDTSKENPIIVNKDDILKVLEWRKSIIDHYNVYVQIICQTCNRKVVKNMARKTKIEYCSINFLSYCRQCSQKMSNQKKYGVDNVFQLEETKEKSKETCVSKYGAEYYKQSDKGKEAFKEYSISRYGVENPFQAEEIKLKSKNTLLSKYNVDNPMKCPTFQEKAKKAMLEKYGVEHALQNMECQDKRQSTCLEKYKQLHFQGNHYKFNNISFDSSWELAYYIYMKDHNMNIARESKILYYDYNGITYRYYPDFIVNNSLIEIKGDQFFDEDNNLIDPFGKKDPELLKAKYDCMKANNVIIVRQADLKPIFEYIHGKYGLDYLKTFKMDSKS